MAEYLSEDELKRLEGEHIAQELERSRTELEKDLSERELRRKDRDRKKKKQEQIRLVSEGQKEEEKRLITEQQEELSGSRKDTHMSEVEDSVDLFGQRGFGSILQTIEIEREKVVSGQEDGYSQLASNLESPRAAERKQLSLSESISESFRKADRQHFSHNESVVEVDGEQEKETSFNARSVVKEKSKTLNKHQRMQEIDKEKIRRERQRVLDIEREVMLLEERKKRHITELDRLADQRYKQLEALEEGQEELARKARLGDEIERRCIKQREEIDAACKTLAEFDKVTGTERPLNKSALQSSVADSSKNDSSVVSDTSMHASMQRQRKCRSRSIMSVGSNRSLELDSNCSGIGDPIESSTDIDDVDNEEKVLKKNLAWIDVKLKQIQEEDRIKSVMKAEAKAHQPFLGKKEKIKETKSIKTENVSRLGKNRILPLPPDIHTFKKEEDDNVEQRLIEKVERLKKKEQDLALRIDTAKLKKEKEERKIKEQTLKEQRVKKLKEKERLLIESLKEKESVLESLENSDQIVGKQRSDGKFRKSHQDVKKSKSDDKCDTSHQEDKKSESDDKCGKSYQEVKKPKPDEILTKAAERVFSFKKPTIPKLTEDTFEEWKIEIEVILESGLYHEDIIRQEVRNSLTGNTRKILLNMDPSASTKHLITKLENTYGNIRTGESVLAEFYNAKQKQSENVADWGVRIESILNTAIKKGQVKREQSDEMLRNRFWRHLKNEQLKNATRVFYETEKDFETLRRKVRVEEKEMNNSRESEKSDTKQVTSQQRTDSSEQMSLMHTLLERMKQLEEKMSTAGQQHQQGRDYVTSQDRGHYNRGGRNSYRGNWRRGYGYRRYRGNYNQDRNKIDDDQKNEKRSDDQGKTDRDETEVKQKDDSAKEKPLN